VRGRETEGPNFHVGIPKRTLAMRREAAKYGNGSHRHASEAVGQPCAQVERQAHTGDEAKEELQPTQLMEAICDPKNMNQAYKRVKANKGAPGADKMTVDGLAGWIREHRDAFMASLRGGTYLPMPVRAVDIPKPGGGTRRLGIPTVRDRLVQQAIAQVLNRILDPIFSESSYGFRPGRGAHTALQAAQEHVADDREFVVDVDLEKFFDRVNHDILMARLERHVPDRRVLAVIRRFLQAGMMENGIIHDRHEGTPQGGPLSPLLANLLLDDLDKELEKRGHKFCRYADDCNIYVRSLKAGERVMASVTDFLEKKLKLRVNREKSAVARVEERKFLGYRLLRGGRLSLAPKSVERFKEKAKELTQRNCGRSVQEVVKNLNAYTTGWANYFRLAEAKRQAIDLDAWLRRRIRCLRVKQCKRTRTIAEMLMKGGVKERDAWQTATSGKGWWRLAKTPATHKAMGRKWFEELGYKPLTAKWELAMA
jgi:RNA-directed DNA polymerase